MLASRWPGKVKLLLMVREPADFLWAAYNIWTLASGIFRCLVLSFASLGSNRTPSTLQPKSQQFALPPRALPGEPKGQEGRTENLGPTLAGLLMVTSFCGFRGKGSTWGLGFRRPVPPFRARAASRLRAQGFWLPDSSTSGRFTSAARSCSTS